MNPKCLAIYSWFFLGEKYSVPVFNFCHQFNKKMELSTKETGLLWTYYIYRGTVYDSFHQKCSKLGTYTVLPKTSRTTFTPEVFLQVPALNRAFQMNIANFFDF
jgi:hypothetical protein